MLLVFSSFPPIWPIWANFELGPEGPPIPSRAKRVSATQFSSKLDPLEVLGGCFDALYLVSMDRGILVCASALAFPLAFWWRIASVFGSRKRAGVILNILTVRVALFTPSNHPTSLVWHLIDPSVH